MRNIWYSHNRLCINNKVKQHRQTTERLTVSLFTHWPTTLLGVSDSSSDTASTSIRGLLLRGALPTSPTFNVNELIRFEKVFNTNFNVLLNSRKIKTNNVPSLLGHGNNYVLKLEFTVPLTAAESRSVSSLMKRVLNVYYCIISHSARKLAFSARFMWKVFYVRFIYLNIRNVKMIRSVNYTANNKVLERFK